MKKFLLILALMLSASTICAASPTCILMKFTDDTRFDKIESAASLSDLVMEKMIASKKFNLTETRPLDENIEIKLYNENLRDLNYLKTAIETGDFNPLFESEGFDENKVQSIATAQVGQIITPEITQAIGKAHNAEYLIQGTIINLGTGAWWSDDYAVLSGVLNLVGSLMSSAIPLGGASDLIGGIDISKTGIGVQSDIRIIKASTGEVIWSKRVVGVNEQTNLNLGLISIGNRKLNNNLYAKAMDKAAQKIVEAMLADMAAGKLFIR
ncbi:MAG: hypothetical protein IKZ53_03705 [Selenomonadaceae bacterium]|nr:hypothetical protein [Selenomonadaceae bacterium]